MRNLFIFLIIIFIGLTFDIFNIFKYSIISSILHELGHILAYRTLLHKWPVVKVSVFGIKMHNNLSVDKQIAVLISGPAINLLLSIISVISLHHNFSLEKVIFLLVNTIILILNILPVYYLDGGQILYIISPYYQKKYIEISILSIIFISVMAIYFTGFNIGIMLFSAYFILNILNDV